MKSQNIYDNPIFFEGYKELRKNPYSVNNLEEKPALYSLSPDLNGKAVLDLGCGYGENCAEFMRLGATRVMVLIFQRRCLKLQVHTLILVLFKLILMICLLLMKALMWFLVQWQYIT